MLCKNQASYVIRHVSGVRLGAAECGGVARCGVRLGAVRRSAVVCAGVRRRTYTTRHVGGCATIPYMCVASPSATTFCNPS
jgi:hypothetical protein